MITYYFICLVTPADYEPPGFKAADSGSFQFEEEPMNIKIGDVSTVSIIYRPFSSLMKVCVIKFIFYNYKHPSSKFNVYSTEKTISYKHDMYILVSRRSGEMEVSAPMLQSRFTYIESVISRLVEELEYLGNTTE